MTKSRVCNALLMPTPAISTPLISQTRAWSAGSTSDWAQCTVRVNDRSDAQAVLKGPGAPTAIHYPLQLSRQLSVANASVDLALSDAAARGVVILPRHPYLKGAEISQVADTLTAACIGEMLCSGLR